MQQNIIQPIDWSATIAAIALVVSVSGTIICPIINTILSNRYQLKLRALDIKERTIRDYESSRLEAINMFISGVGKCLFYSDIESVKQLGDSYFIVYQYVSDDYWPVLDNLYSNLVELDWEKSKKEFPPIAHYLSKILKESPLANP